MCLYNLTICLFIYIVDIYNFKHRFIAKLLRINAFAPSEYCDALKLFDNICLLSSYMLKGESYSFVDT